MCLFINQLTTLHSFSSLLFSQQDECRRKNSSTVCDTSRTCDDDVNEDIAAFYKAKDALLKRREEAK